MPKYKMNISQYKSVYITKYIKESGRYYNNIKGRIQITAHTCRQLGMLKWIQIVAKPINIHRAIISYFPLDIIHWQFFYGEQFILLSVFNNLQSCKIAQAKKIHWRQCIPSNLLSLFQSLSQFILTQENFHMYQILHKNRRKDTKVSILVCVSPCLFNGRHWRERSKVSKYTYCTMIEICSYDQ